jgi:hypothetical protein
MTGTNCDLFTHKSSQSYLNHLVFYFVCLYEKTDRHNILNMYTDIPPRWWLHLIVVRGFEYARDPEHSYWQGLPCWTGQRVGIRRRETPKTDARSSVISSDLKHRANDAQDGSSSYSNRRDQSGLNGCCTAMWKANGKTTTLSLFLDRLFPETDTMYVRSLETGEDALISRRKL